MKDYATGIQHVGIPTKDMDATKKFYEDLGFEAAFETVNDGARVCFLKMHNLVMEVYESEDAAGKIGAIEHVAIDVTDIEQVLRLSIRYSSRSLEAEIVASSNPAAASIL